MVSCLDDTMQLMPLRDAYLDAEVIGNDCARR